MVTCVPGVRAGVFRLQSPPSPPRHTEPRRELWDRGQAAAAGDTPSSPTRSPSSPILAAGLPSKLLPGASQLRARGGGAQGGPRRGPSDTARGSADARLRGRSARGSPPSAAVRRANDRRSCGAWPPTDHAPFPAHTCPPRSSRRKSRWTERFREDTSRGRQPRISRLWRRREERRAGTRAECYAQVQKRRTGELVVGENATRRQKSSDCPPGVGCLFRSSEQKRKAASKQNGLGLQVPTCPRPCEGAAQFAYL